MTLARQLETLGTCLDQGVDAGGLLSLCAGLPDPEPLAWLSQRLLRSGWLRAPEAREAFAEFLIARSETAVQKVLKALVAALRDPAGAAHAEAFEATLVRALEVVPLRALSTMCLLDRTLKHQAPERRDAHVEAVFARCRDGLARGDLGAASLDRLAQVRADAVPALVEAARAGGVLDGFEARRRELARRAIKILESAPKGVSQANAEELLSRRVYTDPGHFLIELLQNAEDAGATTWRVVCDAERIVVWHDGTPFDARDLVGVTSIGQTTKRKQQIGFFGVGFKAVYEVTNRPQVYSDVYRFEIADVSVPKELRERPADLPAEGTVLVLPLRPELARDPARVRDLFARAQALDPCVLLTLPNVDAIELELTERVAGGPTRHVIVESAAGEHARELRQEPDGWVRTYLIEDQRLHYRGAQREAGRAESTQLLIGVRTEGGVPRPLRPEAPTAYSFLPTHQPTGLRFFVQAHFDVPVDRERIAQESDWNRWILTHVPGHLGRVAARVAERGSREAAAGLLEVLPLAEELATAILEVIPAGLPDALRDVPFLPCGDGALHPPAQVLLAPWAVSELYGQDPVDRQGARWALLDPELPERSRRVVAALGCARFETLDLIAVLESELGGRGDGEAAPAALPFLAAGAQRSGAGIQRLYDLLLAEVEERERSDPAGARAVLARLRALPLVPDEAFRLYRVGARGAPVAGDEALRAIYRSLRAFLPRELDGVGDAAATPRARAFLERLGVCRLDTEGLIDDLQATLGGLGSPLSGPEVALLPGSHDGLQRILTLVAAAPHEQLLRAVALPILPARDGRLYPLARDPDDLQGVVAPPSGPLAARLLEFYGTARPIASLNHEATRKVLDYAQAPAVDMELLVADLGREPTPFALDGLPALTELHALLEEVSDELPTRLRRVLAKLSIWPDLAGVAGALRGEDAVRIAPRAEVRAFFPDARFLHDAVCSRAHVSTLGVEPVGVERVISALSPRAHPPFQITRDPPTIERVLRFLLEHGPVIQTAGRETLAKRAAFLSDLGEVKTLGELSRVDSPALRRVYGDSGLRAFVDPTGLTSQVVAKLGLERHLSAVDVEVLVDDLAGIADELAGQLPGAELPLIRSRERLDVLLEYLAQQVAHLSVEHVLVCAQLPLFPDEAGRLGELALEPHELGVLVASETVRPHLAALGARLLDLDAQRRLKPFLETAKVAPAGVKVLVEAVAGKGELPADYPLEALHQLLVEQRVALGEAFPLQLREGRPPANPLLCRLCVWPTVAGPAAAADQLIEPSALLPLCDPGTPERAALDAVRVTESVWERLEALAPLVQPAKPVRFLLGLVEERAEPRAPLSEQPRFLSTLERVRGVAEILLAGSLGASDASAVATLAQVGLPVVDARERLRLSALRRADAETLALLEGLELSGEVVHPRFAGEPGSPVETWLRAWGELEPHEVLGALAAEDDEGGAPRSVDEHAVLSDPDRRQRLYRWLEARQGQVFGQATSRELVARLRLFPSERGRLLSARELVIDVDLPELGIDGSPHPEIPLATLKVLTQQLGVGRPPLAALTRQHLRPAYLAKVRADDREGAGHLLRYMARRAREPGAPALEALLRAPGEPDDLLIEDGAGRFLPPEELLMPLPELAAHVEAVWGERYPVPSPTRYPPADDAIQAFLGQLGVPRTPSRAALQQVFAAPQVGVRASLGLAGLLGELYERESSLLDALPLAEAQWVLDEVGRLRRPDELFARPVEVEALIGGFPEYYLDSRARRLLGGLRAALPFRTVRDVTAAEVAYSLEASAASGKPISFAPYLWFEEQLAAGTLDPSRLREQLAGRSWVYTGEGYFPPARVLGVNALSLFGARRGYWVDGLSRCPQLCQLFGIGAAVTPRHVLEFLTQIGREARVDGDLPLLENERALPHMLLACYAWLGRRGAEEGAWEQALPRDVPVILARERGGGADAGRQRLLAANTPTLFRSETPALEALFAEVGSFQLTEGGPRDDPDVEAFLRGMGIPRLRDAYRVSADGDSGADRSRERVDQLEALRATLGNLAGVLPRVQAQRTQLSPEGWVYAERLRPLCRAGSLRAIEALRVRYVLEGVGEVLREASAAYDPERSVLLVDTRVLDDLAAHTTGLAMGILPCIFSGQAGEQLIDVVELLLSHRSRARMEDYLDRRLFPAGETRVTPLDRLTERISELLDYGLGQKLARRFSSLEAGSLERWRDPELLERMARWLGRDAATEEAHRWSAEASGFVASHLLQAVGVDEPEPELLEALSACLQAEALADLPESLFEVPRAEPEAPPRLEAPPRPEGSASRERPRREPVVLTFDPSSIRPRGRAADPQPPGVTPAAEREGLSLEGIELGPLVLPTSKPQPGPAPAPRPEATPGTSGGRPPSSAPGPQQEAPFWSRVGRWFGLGATASSAAPPKDTQRPAWARQRSNPLSPGAGVPHQLWATPVVTHELASEAPAARLAFTPETLPRPYLYALHGLGATFDPRTQGWSPAGAPAPAWYATCRPSGRGVVFQGRLLEGLSQLPVPLYGRAPEAVEVLPGEGGSLERVSSQEQGGLRVQVAGTPLVRYEVELLEAPALAAGGPPFLRPPALLEPTLPEDALPQEVRAWLELQRAADRSPWELAIAVQEFVQRRYLYDDQFLARPEVARRRGRLRRGKGNHHLELLHASGDSSYLGRGICYELNLLVCELLRHLRVPAMIATCWVLDGGRADRPDHMVALAVLASDSGPCLLPLDAATGPQGPLRTLGPRDADAQPTFTSGQRCPFCHDQIDGAVALTRCPKCNTVFHEACQREFGLCPSLGCSRAAPTPVRVEPQSVLPERPPVPRVRGPWDSEPVYNLPPADAVQHRLARLREQERQRLQAESELIMRAVQLARRGLQAQTPEAYRAGMATGDPQARLTLLNQALGELLPRADLRAAFLGLLRGEYDRVGQLSPALQELVRLGLATASRLPMFRVTPAEPSGDAGDDSGKT
ncbi:MAG: hypothetical protein KDD82_10180 [Planctomycetes bacterium]|nr:hypothetical protein [Planctomycetota bacterium]